MIIEFDFQMKNEEKKVLQEVAFNEKSKSRWLAAAVVVQS